MLIPVRYRKRVKGMTNEEAIDLLDDLIGMVEDNHNSDYDKALQMAIKALEQEPKTDRIEYGIDGNSYKLTISNGNEFNQEPVVYPQVEGITPTVIKQEPCDDAISRQAALDAVNNAIHRFVPRLTGWYEAIPLDCAMAIRGLPPVNPQPKTGHWVSVENEEMKTVGYYCSECDLPMETEQWTDFCPNCGCRMVKPQESEEQE